MIAGQLADVLLADIGKWRILDPIEMKSAGGATLMRLPDASILAKGTNPPNDTYTVSARTTDGHTGLPSGGPAGCESAI